MLLYVDILVASTVSYQSTIAVNIKQYASMAQLIYFI